MKTHRTSTTRHSLLVTFCCAALAAPLFIGRAAAQTAPAQPAPKDEEVVQMDIFNVTTSRDVDYLSQNVESATRLNVAIADIPQNIIVFNEQFLMDVMAVNLEDVTLFDPTINSYADNDSLSIRGQGSGVNYFNGFEQVSGFGSQTLMNTDRVEIIKGPNAVLYGTGAFGGIINRVSKKPTPKPFTRIRASWDSHGAYRFSLDDNFAHTPKKLLFRLNAAIEDGTRWGNRPRYSEMVSLAATWNITRRTTLIADFTHHKEMGVGNWQVGVYRGNPGTIVLNPGQPDEVIFPLDARRFPGYRDIDNRNINRRIFFTDFRHEFSRKLHFRSMFNYEVKQTDVQETWILGANIHWTHGRVLMARCYRNWWQENKNYRMRNELLAFFKTWGWDHKMIIGQSWSGFDVKDLQYRTNNSDQGFADSPTTERFPALDLASGENVDFLTGNVVTGLPEIIYRTNPTGDSDRRGNLVSYYVNDMITIVPDHLIVQAGIRYIRNTAKMNDRVRVADSYDWFPEDALTHTIGVVWHLFKNKSWTFYANRSENFEPNFQLDDSGDDDSLPVRLKSQRGLQYEAGLKYVYRDKFSSLVSVYDIMQNNVAANYYAYVEQPDGGMVSRSRWHTVDGIHSRGFEGTFNWRASPSLTVFGGYAYTHTINEDTGERYHRVPLHAVSLFGRYAVKKGPLNGLSFNSGVVWRSESWAEDRGGDPDLTPVWLLPHYMSIDFGAAYAFKVGKKARVTLSARVTNITDRLNYLQASNLWASISAPRTLTFNALLAF